MEIPEKVTAYLSHQLALDSDRTAIILYSSQMLYSTLFSLLAIVILSYLVGVLNYAIIAVITNSLLRQYAGGAHATAPCRCAIIAAFIFAVLGLITKYFSWSILSIKVFCISTALLTLILVWVFAPADTPNKPIPQDKRKYFRKKALVVLVLWCIFALIISDRISGVGYKILLASTLGLLWESFTLTPWGFLLVAMLDGILAKFTPERGKRPC